MSVVSEFMVDANMHPGALWCWQCAKGDYALRPRLLSLTPLLDLPSNSMRGVSCCAVLCCHQAYCMEFGNVWWLGTLHQEGLDAVLSGEEDMEQPEPVTWLLEQAGLDDLAGIEAGEV